MTSDWAPSRSIKTAYRGYLNSEAGVRAYARFKQILYSKEDSLVQNLIPVLRNLPSFASDPLKVCDVGGGDGGRISRILRFLHEEFGFGFELDFIEQSSYLMRRFDVTQVADFADVRKFESLFEEADLPKGKYDLIFLIHSIFAFQDKNVLEKVFSLRNPRGFVFVVTNAENSFIGGLKKVVDTEFSDRRFEIDDLLKVLDERGMRFQLSEFQTRWEIRDDELDDVVAAIGEWLSLGRYKGNERRATEELRNFVVRNSSCANKMRLFLEDEVVVLIPPITQAERQPMLRSVQTQ
jgi:hypothetical protein